MTLPATGAATQSWRMSQMIRHIFSMTGAVPWSKSRPPHALETSLPGVFAVGDVRSGSAKRVATAVGEGANAVMNVHQVLAE
jgi:NADPH-dependent glutamate synthase beta subunit-like oxidoreductase